MTPRLLLCCWLAFACEKPAPARPPRPVRADVTLSTVTVRQYQGSTLKLSATAPTLELMRGTSDFSAFDASVSLERSGVTILSRTVTGNATAQVASGGDGVRFSSSNGTVGDTERATYDRSIGVEGGAVSDAGLVLDHPRFHLESNGFRADFANEAVDFDRPRTSTKAP